MHEDSQTHTLRDRARKLIIDHCPEYLVYFCHPVISSIAPYAFINRVEEGIRLCVEATEFDKEAWDNYSERFLSSPEKRREWLEPFWTFSDMVGGAMTIFYESGLGEFVLGDLFAADELLFDEYLTMVEEGYLPRVTLPSDEMRQKSYRAISKCINEWSSDEDEEMIDINDPEPEVQSKSNGDTKMIDNDNMSTIELKDIDRSYLPVVLPTTPNPLQAYSDLFHSLPCPTAADQISWDLGSPMSTMILLRELFIADRIDAIAAWKNKDVPLIHEFERINPTQQDEEVFHTTDHSLEEILLCLSYMGGAFRDITPYIIKASFLSRSAWWISDSRRPPDLDLPTFLLPAVQMASVAVAPTAQFISSPILAPHLITNLGAFGKRIGAYQRRIKIRVPTVWCFNYLLLSDAPWPKYNKTRWSLLSPAVEASCPNYLLISFVAPGVSCYVVCIDSEEQLVGSVLIPNMEGDFRKADGVKSEGKCFDCMLERPKITHMTRDMFLKINSNDKVILDKDPDTPEGNRVALIKTKYGTTVVHPYLTIAGRMMCAPKVSVHRHQFTVSNWSYRPGWFTSTGIRPAKPGQVNENVERFWDREGAQLLYTSFYTLVVRPTGLLKSSVLGIHINHLLAPTIISKAKVSSPMRDLVYTMTDFDWQWCLELIKHYLLQAFQMQCIDEKTARRVVSMLPAEREDASHWITYTIEGRRCSFGLCTFDECQAAYSHRMEDVEEDNG